jgi:hypothetical protein
MTERLELDRACAKLQRDLRDLCAGLEHRLGVAV